MLAQIGVCPDASKHPSPQTAPSPSAEHGRGFGRLVRVERVRSPTVPKLTKQPLRANALGQERRREASRNEVRFPFATWPCSLEAAYTQPESSPSAKTSTLAIRPREDPERWEAWTAVCSTGRISYCWVDCGVRMTHSIGVDGIDGCGMGWGVPQC